MLNSDELTGHAKEILKKNLPELVEMTVAKNNKELSDRSLIRDLAPLAINALLLNQDKLTAKKKSDEIVQEAMNAIQKTLILKRFLLTRILQNCLSEQN